MANRLEGQVTGLTRAILEALEEAVVLFDLSGAVAYVNASGRTLLRAVGSEGGTREDLLPKLARLGSRVTALWVGDDKVGEIVLVPDSATDSARSTLAEREREAIITTLSETGWKLTESARLLGISRTTLWRRLRDYGIDRDHRARWSRSS